MPSRWRFVLTRGDIMAAAGLIVLVLLFVAPALLPGRVLIPFDIVTEAWPPWQQPNQPVQVNNMLLADAVNYIVPVKRLLAESVRQGQLPLWNPYVLGGYPFAYNTQAGAFYPLTALYYFLPLLTVVDAVIILQMIMGALFMYAFLRQIALGEIAAFTGAIVFTFNGLMLIWLEWQVVHAAIIWLPLQLLLVERIAANAVSNRPGQSRTIFLLSVLCGVALAMPWLGGHWNWALYNSMTLFAYVIWRLTPMWLKKQAWSERRDLALAVSLIFILGLGLAMIQLLPAFTYLSQSHRQPFTFAQAQERALLNRFIVLLVPKFFGSPVDDNWWGPRNFAETTFYLGMLPLFLTGVAAFSRRNSRATFFLAWGTLGLLWSLGEPAYRMLHILPVFNGFFPSRAVIIPIFAVSVLAGIGIEFLLVASSRERRRLAWLAPVAFLILVALAGVYFWYYRADVSQTWDYLRMPTMQAAISLMLALALAWLRLTDKLNAKLFAGLSAILIIADLFLFGRGYNTVSSKADWFPENAVTNFLKEDHEINRILTTASGIVFPPNSSMVFGLHNLSGYEPGILQRTVDYVNAAEGKNAVRAERVLMPDEGLDSDLLDAFNVKYIVTTHDHWQSESLIDLNQDAIDTWLPIPPGSAVEQQFTTTDAGLHRVDLMFQTNSNPRGVVTARILSADGVLPLAHYEVTTSDIESEEWQSFFFSPFSSEWGRSFLLRVENNSGGQLSIGASREDRLEGGELTGANVPAADLALTTYYFPRPNLVFEDGKTRIYRNPGYFPRAFVVPSAKVAESPDAALEDLKTHQSELDQLVILELGDQAAPPNLGSNGPFSSTVRITDYQYNRITLDVDSSSAGFLVLADTYYPGWRAKLNGESLPVYQANYIMRAVQIPSGQNTVEFSFLPPDFVVGAVISGATIVVVLALLFAYWPRRSARQPINDH